MAVQSDRYVVARPLSRAILKWVLLPAMIIGFAIVAVLVWRATNVESLTRWFFLIGLAVAIPILLIAEIYEFRRGGGPALEADATGIRISGMARLAWSDIAEVRSEEFVGFGGGGSDHDEVNSIQVGGLTIEGGQPPPRTLAEAVDTGSLRVYRRLGIVPADPVLAAKGEMTGALKRINNKMRQVSLSRYGVTPIDFAPFGVMDYELRAPFGEVVARVSAFHPVTTVSDLSQTPSA